MKKELVVLTGLVLMVSFVLASADDSYGNSYGNDDSGEEGYHGVANQYQNTVSVANGDMDQIRQRLVSEYGENMDSIRERLQENEELMLEKKDMAMKKLDDKVMELNEHGNIVRTRLNLSAEGNGSQIRVTFSNGRNAEVKIMPEVASERALERLRLHSCNESYNCSIELKEVGTGNQTRAVYEVRAEKEFRILGLFRSRANVSTEIDVETGDEVSTVRPWWSFLASEEN